VSADLAYHQLLRGYRERVLLESCVTALAWDEETYMPAGGVELRAEQQALLARLEHERAVDPRVGELLAEALAAGHPPTSVEARNLALLRREHDEACRVPRTLIEELARATTRAQARWEDARDSGDATPYLPALARVIELTQALADWLRGEGTRYDACLDEWEPDLTEREVVALFTTLQPPLQALVDRIAGADLGPEPAMAHRPIAPALQRQLSLAAAGWLGFDLERGRIDEAAHPSTMRLGPGDVRLTTRYFPDRVFPGLFATLHELGHGLYDQHLPAEHEGTPLGTPQSLGLHESQSRLVENVIGRSHGFWRGVLPEVRALLAPAFDDVDVDGVYRAINRVARTLNRVEADEVTYDLHIAVRVELERALLRGDLTVGDLPGAWDDAYAAVLVRPPDAAAGFLQDGHWAAGMFGYFPTYTLGNLIAAQLHAAAVASDRALEDELAAGRPAALLEWMRVHVHARGAAPRATIVLEASGAPLRPDHQLARLTRKYAELYRL